MKKYLLSLFALLAVVACEDHYSTETKWKIVNVYVTPNMWEPFYDNNHLFLYYRCIADVPELTRLVYNEGFYAAYLKKRDGEIDVYEPLPAVVYNEEGNGYLWEQSITCDFSPGEVAFYVKSSDFGDEGRVPPRMDFRIVLMW